MGGMSGDRACAGNFGLFGLEAPCADVGVPAAVVFARLDIDRDGVGRTLFQTGHVVGLVEKRDADLAGERTFVHLEDHVLTLPFAACRRSFCHGHYFVNCSFEFHGDAVNGLIILFSAKVTKNRENRRTCRQNSRANFSAGEFRGAAIFLCFASPDGKNCAGVCPENSMDAEIGDSTRADWLFGRMCPANKKKDLHSWRSLIFSGPRGA